MPSLPLHTQAVVFLAVLVRLDWEKELERARVLVDSHREQLAGDLDSESIVEADNLVKGLRAPLISAEQQGTV